MVTANCGIDLGKDSEIVDNENSTTKTQESKTDEEKEKSVGECTKEKACIDGFISHGMALEFSSKEDDSYPAHNFHDAAHFGDKFDTAFIKPFVEKNGLNYEDFDISYEPLVTRQNFAKGFEIFVEANRAYDSLVLSGEGNFYVGDLDEATYKIRVAKNLTIKYIKTETEEVKYQCLTFESIKEGIEIESLEDVIHLGAINSFKFYYHEAPDACHTADNSEVLNKQKEGEDYKNEAKGTKNTEKAVLDNSTVLNPIDNTADKKEESEYKVPAHIKVVKTVKIPIEDVELVNINYSPISERFYIITKKAINEEASYDIMTFKWDSDSDKKFSISPIVETIANSPLRLDFIENGTGQYLAIIEEKGYHNGLATETEIAIISDSFEIENIITKVPYLRFIYVNSVLKGITVNLETNNYHNHIGSIKICDLDFQSQTTIKLCVDKSDITSIEKIFGRGHSNNIKFNRYSFYKNNLLVFGSLNNNYYIYQFDQELKYIKKFNISKILFSQKVLDNSNLIRDDEHLYLVRANENNLEWRIIDLIE